MVYSNTHIEDLFTRIRSGDRFALGKAITLIESKRKDHREAAMQLLSLANQVRADSIRIAVTGAPGVGKSTFIERFGLSLTQMGKRVAILAIDPSSQMSKGSILGDKTRMEKLGNEPNAFIRPSAAGTSLGGVAQRTRETISLCEAAGYGIVIIETVGVGQSEHKVSRMVDFFMLLIQPGGGDALQGIKRGIVEMADLVVVNKADGDREKMAEQTCRHFSSALHFLQPKENGWIPEVIPASAKDGKGITACWESIEKFRNTIGPGGIEQKRINQKIEWIDDDLVEWIQEYFMENPEIARSLRDLKGQVRVGTLTPGEAIIKIQGHIKGYIHARD